MIRFISFLYPPVAPLGALTETESPKPWASGSSDSMEKSGGGTPGRSQESPGRTIHPMLGIVWREITLAKLSSLDISPCLKILDWPLETLPLHMQNDHKPWDFGAPDFQTNT